MKRISRTTVELTALEMDASEFFEVCLDNGLGVHEAVAHVRQCPRFGPIDEAFWAYLAS